MLGRVLEYHLVGRVRQKRRAAFHRLQTTSFAFDPQCLWGDPFPLSHPPDQRLGLMDIQIIHHQVPPGRLSITDNQTLDVSERILLSARWSPRWLDDLTGDHIEIDKPGQRCRMYSNSRRSTCPACIGRSGALRSNACTPVNSSRLIVRSPCLARAAACAYTWHPSTIFSSRCSSAAAVNQYRKRCGCSPPS
jgi:hypothetical protein